MRNVLSVFVRDVRRLLRVPAAWVIVLGLAVLPAFYAWVKFDIPGLDSEGVCDYILKEAKVVGVPGIAYGTDDSCVRFSFASSEEDLKQAVERIGAVMAKVKR